MRRLAEVGRLLDSLRGLAIPKPKPSRRWRLPSGTTPRQRPSRAKRRSHREAASTASHRGERNRDQVLPLCQAKASLLRHHARLRKASLAAMSPITEKDPNPNRGKDNNPNKGKDANPNRGKDTNPNKGKDTNPNRGKDRSTKTGKDLGRNATTSPKRQLSPGGYL